MSKAETILDKLSNIVAACASTRKTGQLCIEINFTQGTAAKAVVGFKETIRPDRIEIDDSAT